MSLYFLRDKKFRNIIIWCQLDTSRVMIEGGTLEHFLIYLIYLISSVGVIQITIFYLIVLVMFKSFNLSEKNKHLIFIYLRSIMKNVVSLCPSARYIGTMLNKHGDIFGHHIVLNSCKIFNAYLYTVIFNSKNGSYSNFFLLLSDIKETRLRII